MIPSEVVDIAKIIWGPNWDKDALDQWDYLNRVRIATRIYNYAREIFSS